MMREMVCTAFLLLMAPVMGALAVDEREGYNITVSIKVDEQKQDGRPWDAGGTNALPDIRGTIIFINDNEKALDLPRRQDTLSLQVSMRNVRLKPQDQIQVIIEDEDFVFNDQIAEGFLTYEGGTRFVVKNGAASFEFDLEGAETMSVDQRSHEHE